MSQYKSRFVEVVASVKRYNIFLFVWSYLEGRGEQGKAERVLGYISHFCNPSYTSASMDVNIYHVIVCDEENYQIVVKFW